MIARPRMPPDRADLLPPVRGRLQASAPLGPASWFNVGGAAEWLFRPADPEDLAALLAGAPPQTPITVLGAASNVIVRDGGIPGVVVRLGRGFNTVVCDTTGITAGAACLDVTVAEHAAAAGLGGLEFLSGIPGSIGGAIAMNAGAYGGDIAQCLEWADIVTAEGAALRLSATALNLTYRHAALPPGAIVIRARLRAQNTDPALIASRMADIRAARGATQPIRARTGGSTFRNPDPAQSTLRAWELIEAAGGRGLTRGGAQVSTLHCNFLLNTGTATAADLEGLGEDLRARVHAMSGIALHWEIKRLGIPAAVHELAA